MAIGHGYLMITTPPNTGPIAHAFDTLDGEDLMTAAARVSQQMGMPTGTRAQVYDASAQAYILHGNWQPE